MDPAILKPGHWYVLPGSRDRLLRFERQDQDGYIFSVFKGTTPEAHEDLLQVITIYNVAPLEPWRAELA